MPLSSLAIVLQLTLTLLIFVQSHSELPQSARDLALQTAQTAVNQATRQLATDASASVGLHGIVSSTTAFKERAVDRTSAQAVMASGWKTYANIQYGFSLRYPSGASISFLDHVLPLGSDIVLPCDGVDAGTSSCTRFIEKDGSFGSPNNFSFFVFQSPMRNLETYVRSHGQPNDFETLTINGRPAYRAHFGNYPHGFSYLYIQDSAHMILFRFSDASEQLANAVLSTLKFDAL